MDGGRICEGDCCCLTFLELGCLPVGCNYPLVCSCLHNCPCDTIFFISLFIFSLSLQIFTLSLATFIILDSIKNYKCLGVSSVTAAFILLKQICFSVRLVVVPCRYFFYESQCSAICFYDELSPLVRHYHMGGGGARRRELGLEKWKEGILEESGFRNEQLNCLLHLRGS